MSLWTVQQVGALKRSFIPGVWPQFSSSHIIFTARMTAFFWYSQFNLFWWPEVFCRVLCGLNNSLGLCILSFLTISYISHRAKKRQWRHSCTFQLILLWSFLQEAQYPWRICWQLLWGLTSASLGTNQVNNSWSGKGTYGIGLSTVLQQDSYTI